MINVVKSLRTAAAKRAQYNRIVAEIQSMPLDVALDLDIYRGDAHRIASEAVYGR